MIRENAADNGWDFFVSYTQADRPWAEWAAWILEEAGYQVLIQAWDSVPGTNWPHMIRQGVSRGGRLLAVLSPAYLRSVAGSAEWEAVWAADMDGARRRIIPLLVADCDTDELSLLGTRSWVDLRGYSGEDDGPKAAEDLLAAVRALDSRVRPSSPVPLPTRPTSESDA